MSDPRCLKLDAVHLLSPTALYRPVKELNPTTLQSMFFHPAPGPVRRTTDVPAVRNNPVEDNEISFGISFPSVFYDLTRRKKHPIEGHMGMLPKKREMHDKGVITSRLNTLGGI